MYLSWIWWKMADQSIILITRGGKLTALPETTQLDFGEGQKGEGKGRRETETPQQ